jgi:hypothetical protein
MNHFTLNKGSIYALPVLHYKMEFAQHVKLLFNTLKPDCVAVELPETLQKQFLHAASRLPDISVIRRNKLFFLCEPCEPSFEGLRCALESGIDAYCVDLDVDDYPLHQDHMPDPYSAIHIGLSAYYAACYPYLKNKRKTTQDLQRELYMARRLKELSLSYERILFIGGFYHVESVLELSERNSFDTMTHACHDEIALGTLTEESCREVMAECGWITSTYELWRTQKFTGFLDRQKVIYQLYKLAADHYKEIVGTKISGQQMGTLMKFVRNYAWIHERLMPDLFEILSAAKGCIDPNYAYEAWLLATSYPHHRNIDNLPEWNLTAEQVWGHSKIMRFNLKQKRRKGLDFQKRKKDSTHAQFYPPAPFSLCSYPPEDLIIENFSHFLKKKGAKHLDEAATRTLHLTTSLEDGIDIRETLRHLAMRKIFVKMKGRTPQNVGSIVIVFDEDSVPDHRYYFERYSWKMTWHGEHTQESDMAFYATPMTQNIVGPGISRCEYGGFMMSYPPRRLLDVWHDPDYEMCHTKAEILLMAAIDYAVAPSVVYVAHKPPRTKIRHFAKRFGKKVIFIPLKTLSPAMLNKVRFFHVLDGHDKREIAGEYIF